ncbi:hypothetical protein SSX86_015633 [Deinandra increscens subsp. villosa]|uniref:Gnk2-homologous domain-containing protein n=1 Tax=Deinandra increscens subsp. villosa TaxID=3103831 RepID=A0AAP0D3V1_9ASTR
MKSIILFLFLLLPILSFVTISMAADIFRCKKDSGTFQPTSPYKTNIQAALKKLVDGSNTAFFGIRQDEVKAVALCAGYLNPKDCASCLNTSIPLLLQKCPNQKIAAAWRNTCMIRYGAPVETTYDLWFVEHEVSVTKAKDVQGLENNLPMLVQRLALSIGRDRSSQLSKYGYGTQGYGSPPQSLHLVMQCSPDTKVDDCKKCVFHLSEEMKRCCGGAMGATMFTPNCYMRYAHDDFRTK